MAGWTSPNHGPRPAGVRVDTLVLHYTGMRSAEAALSRLCDPQAQVSAHYLIEEDGTVHALVPEERRAWHAGVSAWRGETNLNDRSIGIELVNPGHEWGYRPFPEPQIAALIGLCHAIQSRHAVVPERVVGHSDIAPARKLDPGELFPWPRLAGSGIGIWPERPLEPVEDVDAALRAIGYAKLPESLSAFQRRFRPSRIDGLADPETRGLLAAVARLYAGSA